MDVLEAIRERRCTRAFSPAPVDEATVRSLLDAAIQAPSARNSQPWSFVVIENRALLARISQATIRRMAADPYWRMYISFEDSTFDIFYGAPLVVVICARGAAKNAVGDCYLAGQNLMLAAHAAGLGTCPIGLAREELQSQGMRHELSIPVGAEPVLPIAIGHAKGAMVHTERNPPAIHAWLR